MGKVVAFVLAVCVAVAMLAWDVQLTKAHLYNNGIHRNCGGLWTVCERCKTGEWVYCSRCGVQSHR